MMDPAPQTVERGGDLHLLRPRHPHVNVAPSGRGRQVPGLRVCHGFDSAQVDDVHSAEIRHLVIDDQQFSMVAAIEDPQK